jgi:hypothetical protein
MIDWLVGWVLNRFVCVAPRRDGRSKSIFIAIAAEDVSFFIHNFE